MDHSAPGRAIRCTTALAGLLALAGCGGGGGGGGTNAVLEIFGFNGQTLSPNALSAFFVSSFAAFEDAAANLRNSNARYTVQSGTVMLPDNPRIPGNQAGNYLSYPLASARVEYAHAAGLTGRGQTISIVDDGFLQTHEALARAGNSSTGSPSVNSHGTEVASVAAGNSATMIGVAPGATLHFGDWSNGDLAAVTNRARALGAVAQNNSWGFVTATGNTLYATPQGFNEVFSDPAGSAYLDALFAYAADGVVIFAVSNDVAEPAAGIMDGLPGLGVQGSRNLAALEPGWLAVANAVPRFTNSGITSATLYSAPCLDAARWCLVADGFWYAATSTSTTSYDFAVGSSFAAPQVAGAMALLAEAFPGLTPHDLRVRLLASADNGFFRPDGSVELAPGFFHDFSNLFGHGFLDLRAALLPIGPVTMTMGDGSSLKVSEARFTTGAAMGDAVAESLAGVDLALSDSLNGGFKMAAADLTAASTPESLGPRLLARSLSADYAKTRTEPASGLRPAFADFQGRTMQLTDADTGLRAAVLLPPEGSTSQEYGVSLTQPLSSGPLKVDLGLTVARDEGTLLGFGTGDGQSAALASVGLTLSREYDGGGFFSVQAEMGIADLGRPEALSRVSSVGFDSLGVTVGRRGVFAEGDRLALGVALPTAVTAGSASMDVAVATEGGGQAVRSVGIDLAPSERQVDFSLSYFVPVGEATELMFEVQHARNHGNRAGVSDTAGVVGVKFTF